MVADPSRVNSMTAINSVSVKNNRFLSPARLESAKRCFFQFPSSQFQVSVSHTVPELEMDHLTPFFTSFPIPLFLSLLTGCSRGSFATCANASRIISGSCATAGSISPTCALHPWPPLMVIQKGRKFYFKILLCIIFLFW